MNRDDAEGQLTVGIYVDDIIITCKSKKTIDELIRALEIKYKQLKVHRGLTHNYLGMVLDFSTPCLVRIEQSGMIREITKTVGLDELQKTHGIKEPSITTPAADYLFSTSTSLPVLSTAEGKLIHSVTAKIMFIANRGRPDLLTFISYMTKRVLQPTAEDARKPLRAIAYLKATADIVLQLGYSGTPRVYTYIDASFGTHSDRKSHTGVYATLGTGGFYT